MKFGLKPEYEIVLSSIFKKYNEIEEVILYGSRAKGNYSDRSDIDFAVRGNIDRHIISHILLDADESMIPYKLDVQDYSKINNYALKDHIDRVGKLFYKKESL
jgi:uncharacterized protein